MSWIDDRPVRGGLTRWDVELDFGSFQEDLWGRYAGASTVDPFAADELLHAKENGLPVMVSLKDTRYGYDLIAVEAA